VEIEIMNENSTLPPGSLEIKEKDIIVNTLYNKFKLCIMHCSNYGYLSSKRFIQVYNPTRGETLVPIDNNDTITNILLKQYNKYSTRLPG
jgi:hypothetical protein